MRATATGEAIRSGHEINRPVVAPMIPDPEFHPSPWVREGYFCDIDAQAAQYRGYEQRYQQLSRGPFEGRCKSFVFGTDLAINLETANRELAQTASTPSGRYGACILADASPPCALNAQALTQHDVVLCPERKSLEGTTPEGMRIYCMDISRELFPHDEYNMLFVGVRTDPLRSRQLRELIEGGIATFVTLQSLDRCPAAVRSFKSCLIDILWQLTAKSTSANSSGPRHHNKMRALGAFKRARDYIHHGLVDGISIAELCRETGISRRALEYVFRSVVGVGPASYIRLLQLNYVRRDLLSDRSKDVCIGSIAARYGMWHWSRFSRYYRLQFGELPSQTRLRNGLSQRGGDPCASKI
jgi:AraC family transcriptional regulator, ethanolamine operon transcriptional activator